MLPAGLLLLWLYRSGRMGTLRALGARQWLGLACASAVGVLGYSIFFLLALQSVPAGKAAMVVAYNPVLTLVCARQLFRERINAAMCIGVALAVAGAWYALSGGDGGARAGRRPGQGGEWLLLGCAGCWVAYTLMGRVVLTTVDALTTTTLTAVMGAAFLLLASLLLEGRSAWQAVAAALALAYAWYLHGVQRLGAGAAAAYMALVPLFGMLFSSLWLGEPLTAALLRGGAMALRACC